jgi:hypothetical protein
MSVHGIGTAALSVLLVGIGVAIVARTAQLGGGGGLGYVIGALFVAAGAGRLYLASRR